MLLGFWRGVVGEIIALVAWVVAFFAARVFGQKAGELLFLTHIAEAPIRTVAGWVTVFVCVLILLALARSLARALIRALGLTVLDRFAGLFFGMARGLLIVLALVAAGGLTALPKEPWWREARLSPPLEIIVLSFSSWLPEEIAKRIQFR
jgi:membrane protein required for colicin V production